MRLLKVLLGILASLSASTAAAGEVRIAVAPNFAAPMKQIAEQFERETGHKALISLGATGELYAQIRNGAPFDVLLAADDVRPKQTVSQGLGVKGSVFTYATGRLALWSKSPTLVDAKGAVLREDGFDRLAIANYKTAPYGAAALNAIEQLGVRQALIPRLVEGKSIGQVYQFVSTGNADLGFVGLSQITQNGKITEGSAWIVPAALHPPIRQDAVLLTRGADNPVARALMAHLQSEKTKALIRSYGYEVK